MADGVIDEDEQKAIDAANAAIDELEALVKVLRPASERQRAS